MPGGGSWSDHVDTAAAAAAAAETDIAVVSIDKSDVRGVPWTEEVSLIVEAVSVACE